MQRLAHPARGRRRLVSPQTVPRHFSFIILLINICYSFLYFDKKIFSTKTILNVLNSQINNETELNFKAVIIVLIDEIIVCRNMSMRVYGR